MRTARRSTTDYEDSPQTLARWPQPQLDPSLACAIYRVGLEELQAAALRLEHRSVLGIRRFSAFRRVLPLEHARVAAREMALAEREEEDPAAMAPVLTEPISSTRSVDPLGVNDW